MKQIIVTAAALIITTGAAFSQSKNTQKKTDNQTDSRIQTEVKARAANSVGEGQSNEKFPQAKRIEDAYPLDSDTTRGNSSKLLQQLTVDLLALFNQNKEAHWNVNGPLYLSLHEFFQEQADFYRGQADIFAERNLQLGYSVDGRYSTIAKTTNIPDFPAGYVSDNEAIKLMLDRVTVLQKEVYIYIKQTEDSDPVTSNKLQDLAYFVDKNLWQLRIHIQKPGSTGENLPWNSVQGRDRTGQNNK